MTARRNTPFEVMGKATAGSESERSDLPTPPSAQSSAKPPPQPDPIPVEEPGDLLAPGEPLVLRIPKGFAAGAVALLLLLLVLAYWVGYQRGSGASVRGEQNAVTPSPPGPLQIETPPAFIGADLDSAGVVPINLETTPLGPHRPGSDADPRRDGLNYLILATYPADEADRLADFLAGQGVATVLDPVNNARFQVIAVNVGFTRDAFEQGIHETYRRTMLEIGRAWHAHNGRRGSDALQDMYFYRHGP
ncbi:hypothetical protein [Mucisphaera calidilacus]|uniref:Uncharacterized protein n=1 Tax=Mucisphaera calidilacus TaxID=2527982 RepID=A0A518BWE1_9BACT|nr:hypothetical protein [Mucisphaera calidilacus]QDU71288.1 hypothetical protein Pan265_11370 [Mucisphaera calidilacus]